MGDTLALRFSDAPEEERYEAYDESGQLTAVITYRLAKRWIALLHTEVRPEFEGRGIASRFASWAFEDARSRSLKVVPKCPYILAWLPRHPEVHDLLARAADAGTMPSDDPATSADAAAEPRD